MAAALCCTTVADSLQQASGSSSSPGSTHAPINFLYGHLHNSIRTELGNLSTWALSLEAGSEQDLQVRLLHLKERYHFLEQVYKYHSSVEDEVVYPALDTKVKNVTSAYSVEHQDEEYLFEHLAGLLSSALAQTGAERTATVRQLICKIEEIHTTLRKHLAKEEAQLLPLLLQHFSHAEQAELVAQFLYCVPLDTVGRVLAWLKPLVPLAELEALMQHLREVIPDRLLLQLLVTWLNPLPAPAAAAGGGGASSGAAVAAAGAAALGGGSAGQLVMCPFAAAAKAPIVLAVAPAAAGAGSGSAAEAWPPLRGIVLFHHSIRGALEVFVTEAAGLQGQAGVSAGQLAGLVERHRFLRSVCMFHTLSEEEVMFPEVLRISGLAQAQLSGVLAACSTCQAEHTSEVVLFEELGRLLADVRAHVRRGRTRDVSGMLGRLVDTARRVCSAIGAHMQREESEVLPLLAAALSPEQQRGMVWHTLRAMPLRLLERVLPWLLSKLSDEDAEGMMANLRLGAPLVDQQLVELLLRWAQRGRWPLPEAAVAGTGAAGVAAQQPAAAPVPPAAAAVAGAGSGPAAAGAAAGQQQQLERRVAQGDGSSGDAGSSAAAAAAAAGTGGGDAAQSFGGLVPAAVIEALCRSCSSAATLQQQQQQGEAQPSSDAGAAASAAGGEGASGEAAAAGSDPAQQQQQQQAWSTYDPVYFSNNTCELRLIRQASDCSGSPRKRQRLAAADGSGPDSGSADGTPTAVAAAAAAAAAAGVAAAAAGAVEQAAVALACVATAQQQQQQQQQHSDTGYPQQQQQGMVISRTPSNADPAPAAAAGAGAAAAGAGAPVAGGTAAGSSSSSSNAAGCNPIDHIFQFHKALRRELKQLESDAAALEQAVLAACEQLEQQQQQQPDAADAPPAQAAGDASSSGGSGAASLSTVASGAALLRQVSRWLQQLDGRFHFLWGIYRAHSKAEDEIVFPALESKEALHNVSHAYTLDHEQEEQLFHDLAAVIGRVRGSGSAGEVRDLALQLRRMCAAVRASLETHVRAEEAELWPLFSEHFSIKEQQHLVGVIIGRTGAEVLQALLPWVTGSFSEEETQAMMGSLREATKNTMFDQWLGAVQSGGAAAGSAAGVGPASLLPSSSGGGAAGPQQQQGEAGAGADAAAGQQHQQQQQQQMDDLAEIVEYLTGSGGTPGTPAAAAAAAGAGGQPQLQPQPQQTEVSGTVAESTNYVPGWEDIFNINQKQLEAAIRRVSTDPNLEPQRKAYLIQNIMVSRYIVAQQRRMHLTGGGAAGAGGAGAGAAAGAAPGAAAAAAAGAGGVLLAGCGAAGAAGGGCQHQHQHHDHSQQQQQPGQLGGGSNAAALAAVAAAGATATGSSSGRAVTYADAAAGVLGCQHYRRSAQLVSPCCGKVFTCRLCHDDACDHRLDRYAVSEMQCMLCGTRQPVAGSCGACGARLSAYYCAICHLFDDEPGRDIYHCPFCNVCRRGKGLGVDFFHCMQCNSCMSLSLFNSHTCRERAMEGNCPVCHEYLFDSSTPIKELPCGHFLHSACFAEYARYSYTCPICCKSIGDMSVYFQMLDSLLAAERPKLPPEYAGRRQSVLCQDCGRVGAAPYHFVYHACPACHSYNTRLL